MFRERNFCNPEADIPMKRLKWAIQRTEREGKPLRINYLDLKDYAACMAGAIAGVRSVVK
jgi:hypothetical protein